MNASAILKVNGSGTGAGGDTAPAAGWYPRRRMSAGSIGLWLFMGVASALFSLFIAAYVMRMDSSDWSPIALPPQLLLSTSLLVSASVLLQRSAAAARTMLLQRARVLFVLGGACALAFLLAQWWAWQILRAMQVTPTGNPAGSFFYLLTAMHGLHVLGGLAGWSFAARSAWEADTARSARRIGLCARYWHFLLALWLVLYATLAWLTPEAVRLICGTR